MTIQVGWVTGEHEMHLIPISETDDIEAGLQLSGHERHRECFCYPHKGNPADGWEEWTMWVHSDKPPVKEVSHGTQTEGGGAS